MIGFFLPGAKQDILFFQKFSRQEQYPFFTPFISNSLDRLIRPKPIGLYLLLNYYISF